jgi:CheY-like chemotaxis protein
MAESVTILVVDDEKGIREGCGGSRVRGVRRRCCRDGKMALEMVTGKPYDLILVDLMMPVRAGLSSWRM